MTSEVLLSELQRAQAASVIEYVGAALGVEAEAITGPRVHAPSAHARQVVMYLLRERLGWTCVDIGLALGRDHSTVVHGTARIRRLQATDAELALLVARAVFTLVDYEPERGLASVLAAARRVELELARLYQPMTMPQVVEALEAVGEAGRVLQRAIASMTAPTPITRIRPRLVESA